METEHRNTRELFGETCIKCGNITNYANDSTFHFASKSREVIQSKIIEVPEKIRKFLVANKLTINTSKTTLMEIMLKQKRSKLSGIPPSLSVRCNQQIKTITAATECFLLGGSLQFNMSWQAMIDTGEKSILKRMISKLGALKYCCRKMSKLSKLLLANAFIISRLLYLLPVYGGTDRKYLNKLQVIINNTARFVTGLGRRINKQTLMEACGWLDIDELVQYHSLVQLWRIINLKVPMHIYRKLIINENFTVETLNPRLQNTMTSFRWWTIRAWNDLSQDIRSIQTLPNFKKQVKIWIIEKWAPNPGLNVSNMDG